MTTIAIFPGSFDPLTLGHEDIVRRATLSFDKVIVLVQYNPAKANTYLLHHATRYELCVKSFEHDERVSVIRNDNPKRLTVDIAAKHQATTILRGVRNAADLAYEASLEFGNRYVSGDSINTMFMLPSPEYVHVSSSFVKELFGLNQAVDQFVAPHVAHCLSVIWNSTRHGVNT